MALRKKERGAWKKPLVWAAVLSIMLGAAFLPPAEAKFPEKPVVLVVPFGAGGGTDLLARGIQPFVSKYLGSQVVIENVPGGNGIVGYTKLFTGKGDGYTLCTVNWPDIYTNKIMFSPAYDPDKFTPIAGWANMPMVLSTHTDFKDFKDFIETARKRKVSIGHAGGVGSTGWVLNLSIEKGTGIEFNKVPYSASGAVPAAVAGKHVDGMIGVSQAILPMVKSGQIKVLVSLYDQRDLLYPDVPTAKELGYTFKVFAMLRGVIGPPNMPREVVKTLEEAFLKAAADPEYLEICKKTNILVTPLNSEGFGQKMGEARDFLAPFADVLRKK